MSGGIVSTFGTLREPKPNPRQRMLWLLAAFGAPGSQPTTQAELDALTTLTARIVDTIPIRDELSEAERAARPIYGAILDDYKFVITPVAAPASTEQKP